ncbi:MAG: UbiX family flavin prenyltransferase [Candidatus Freyarchaeota archaeon]|nr:UbiX family flavin prenyltransferase [Candidatus Jordarchaeia archaeon]
MRIVVGVTGASGAIYAYRLLEELKKRGDEVILVVSDAAKKVVKFELGFGVEKLYELATQVLENNDLTAPIASGSYPVDAVVIVPCSMATLAAISTGQADTLIRRAADCALTEGRNLILVPRETPLNLVHIENMMRAKMAGAVILPAMPAFYHSPKTVGDLVDFVVGKILDALRVPHNLYRRWEGDSGGDRRR